MNNGKEQRQKAGVDLDWARQQLAAAKVEAKAVATQAAHDGVPEAVIARDLGVSRMTIRNWLGK